MIYSKFKKMLEKVENIDYILKLFKTNVENNMLDLKQNYEIAKNDYEMLNGIPVDEQSENFNYEWEEISSKCIFDLYNKMGWSISELLNKKSVLHSLIADCEYIPYYLSDAWTKIQQLDGFEFFYSMIIFVKGIEERRKAYRYIYYPIKIFLMQYELDDILKEETKTVFIAMSFDEEMVRTRELISKVVKESGYIPMIIDLKEHNNQIIPEVFFEIKNSRFVIADLTQQKTGVYYEAGYASALEKKIIYSCRSNNFEEIHFDVAQQNIIKWDDEKQLGEKLEKRIKATIGKAY